MATLTWVGGNGTWDTTTTAVWSPAQVPTAADNVVFNSATTYTVTMTGALACLDITVSAGTVTFSTGTTPTLAISGSMSLVAGTIWNSTGTITFNATTSKTITTNGTTIGGGITINGVGGTFQLLGPLTLGSTQTFTLTNGTIDINNNTLTTGFFSSSNSSVRSIAFGSSGTGNITCIAAGGIIWTTAATANLTTSGIPIVNISNNSATASTVTAGALSEANSISFNFTVGTYSLTFLQTSNHSARSINFTGFSGTWLGGTFPRTVYGSLTLSSAVGFSMAGSSGTLSLAATSGTQIITTNGKTIDEPMNMNGVGGTVQLADALTMGTRALTLTNGTFDGNNKTISGATSFTMVTGSVIAKNISTAIAFTHTSGTLTQGSNNSTGAYTLTAGTLDLGGSTYTLTVPSFTTAAGTKNLTFNGGTLAVTSSTTTSFNNAVPTGFSTTPGTGIGKISMTGATGKTFVGGGSTYSCTLSNDGAGALTITGSNTFTTITNGVQPTSFLFTATTTTTVTNWTVRGTSGNLVTIGSVTAASHTLSKTSGIVNSDYLSISRSTATGGATWYAGANSTNGGNNSGWIFSSAPAIGRSFGWIIT